MAKILIFSEITMISNSVTQNYVKKKLDQLYLEKSHITPPTCTLFTIRAILQYIREWHWARWGCGTFIWRTKISQFAHLTLSSLLSEQVYFHVSVIDRYFTIFMKNTQPWYISGWENRPVQGIYFARKSILFLNMLFRPFKRQFFPRDGPRWRPSKLNPICETDNLI